MDVSSRGVEPLFKIVWKFCEESKKQNKTKLAEPRLVVPGAK